MVNILANALIAFKIGRHIGCVGNSFSWRLGHLLLKKRDSNFPYGIICLASLRYLWNFLVNNHWNSTNNFLFGLFCLFWVDSFFLDHHIGLSYPFNLILLILFKNLRMVSLLHPSMAFITIHLCLASRILNRFQFIFEIPEWALFSLIIVFKRISSKVLNIMSIYAAWPIMSLCVRTPHRFIFLEKEIIVSV